MKVRLVRCEGLDIELLELDGKGSISRSIHKRWPNETARDPKLWAFIGEWIRTGDRDVLEKLKTGTWEKV